MTIENDAAAMDFSEKDFFVFTVQGVAPYEFSAAASSDRNAWIAIWEDMTKEQQDAMPLGTHFQTAEISYFRRDPNMRPMLPSDFLALMAKWKADPSSFDLDELDEYPQHKDALRKEQKRHEKILEDEREAVRVKEREFLKERARRLGVSVDAMAIIEAMQQEFAKLHDRLNQIK